MTGKTKSPAASETLDTLMEVSRLLNTGLDEETMAICIRLCENGINPESLAKVIKELKKQAANLDAETSLNNTPSGQYSR